MGQADGYNQWLGAYVDDGDAEVKGLVSVRNFSCLSNTPPETVSVMEKAKAYDADAVFFQASANGGAPIAQAFIYRNDSLNEQEFAKLHQRLWSWGGVPLVYRVVPGAVHLFRCKHKPDFEKNEKVIYKPYETLGIASDIASDEWWAQQDPWWNWQQLRNGSLWDDPQVCENLLSGSKAAHKTLIDEVKRLYNELGAKKHLPRSLQRRLLILSILIAYLEERGVFKKGFFGKFREGASAFHEVLADGNALVALLESLETRFNGHVFSIPEEDKTKLRDHSRLSDFSKFVWGYQQSNGQMTLWKRYSFADLPIELISHIYQLFVEDKKTAVYTPHFLVRLMVDEAMDQDLMDRLVKNDEVVLDPACGSGIFLVEAYKRLVLHWRQQNNWDLPRTETLRKIVENRLRGVDLEKSATELTAVSLCLAMCDALSPEAIRQNVQLFPYLLEKTIHRGCFFEAVEKGKLDKPVGLILGNPPFASVLKTDGAKRAKQAYEKEYGSLPDKQIGYLFLHGAMKILAPGGRLCLLQHYGFLYNKNPLNFRQEFQRKWNVREILDFISITGLFGNSANTKVVCVVADAENPNPNRNVLHAVFRRSGRTKAQQGFDIDYYDFHWLPRELPITNDRVWRCNLLGGGRVLGLADRLESYGTLADYTIRYGWGVPREGWIFGNSNDPHDSRHITGKHYVEPDSFCDSELSRDSFLTAPDRSYQRPREEEQYEPPLFLIHEHADLHFATWHRSYLTYRHSVVGISAASGNTRQLDELAKWFKENRRVLKASIVMTGTRPLVSKATAVLSGDICKLPCPKSGDLEISPHEQILVDDIVDYYRDFVRLGESSAMMTQPGEPALDAFNEVFLGRINAIYGDNPLRALQAYTWPGAICQPYIFGDGDVNWTGVEKLRDKLDSLLREQRGCGLNVTRIAWCYDDACIYLLKPNRLRYWLRSIALRDSDEVLEELEAQGF